MMKLVIAILCLVELSITVTCLEEGQQKLCQSEDDCGDGECCVVQNLKELFGNGTCKPFTTMDTPCSELDAILSYYGDKYIKHCPCESKLECMPTNTTEDNNLLLPEFSCQAKDANFEEREFVIPRKKVYYDDSASYSEESEEEYEFMYNGDKNEVNKSKENEIGENSATETSTTIGIKEKNSAKNEATKNVEKNKTMKL